MMNARIGWHQPLNPTLIVVPILGFMMFLYRGSLASIWSLWTTDLVHGLPLFAILSFLVYQRWREFQPLTNVKTRAGAITALALLSLLWVLAGLGHVRVVQDVAFYCMVFPLFWITYGYRKGLMLSWPLILVLTAFPLLDHFIPLHREITTAASVRILNGLGISSVSEGFMISVPAGDFSINRGCSGIAQFSSALAVTGLYAYIERLSLFGTIALIALGWLVAITGNVVRVVIVVAAGQATSMQTSLINDHIWLGWIVFSVGITALLWTVGRRLPQSEAISDGLDGTGVQPEKKADRSGSSPTALVATLLAVALGPVVFSVAVSITQPTFREASSSLPEQVGPWRRSPESEASWRPYFVGADAESHATYRNPAGGELDVFVATYVEQRQGKEAVFYRNRVYERARWHEAQNPSQYQLGQKTAPQQVIETLLQGKQGGRRLVWHWYLIGERTLSRSIEAKLASIVAALRGDRSARVVILSAPVRENLDATRDRLRGFAIRFGETMTATAL